MRILFYSFYTSVGGEEGGGGGGNGGDALLIFNGKLEHKY